MHVWQKFWCSSLLLHWSLAGAVAAGSERGGRERRGGSSAAVHGAMPSGRQISEKYTLGEELGRGGFATVFECRNSLTGGTVAVKRIGLRNLSKDALNTIEQEVALLKRLDHPNIVKYIETVRGEGEEYFFIVLEFMENGSLARNIKLFGTLSQSLCAIYVRQVLNVRTFAFPFQFSRLLSWCRHRSLIFHVSCAGVFRSVPSFRSCF